MDTVHSFNSSSRYTLKRQLGAGGSAEVFLYLRETPGLPTQEVVLKILREQDEASLQELINEGRRLAELKHPHILPAFGYERIDMNRYGLVLEYIPGCNLKEILPRLLSDERELLAASIIRTLCEALHAAHVQGVIHGDLSSRNILVSRLGELKLSDFGLSRRSNVRKEGVGPQKGSLDYLAPERWRGEPTSVSADIFALGLLAYEILAGENPLALLLPRDGERGLQRFLHEESWRLFSKWENFFRLCLDPDPQRRASLTELTKVIPASTGPFNPEEALALAVTQQTAEEKKEELAVTRFIRSRISLFSFLDQPHFLRLLKTSLHLTLFIFLLAPEAIGTDHTLRQSRMRPSSLTLTSSPWGEVFLDGKSIGYTPILNQTVPTGFHHLRWRAGNGFTIRRTLMDYGNGVLTYQIVKKRGSEAIMRPIP